MHASVWCVRSLAAFKVALRPPSTFGSADFDHPPPRAQKQLAREHQRLADRQAGGGLFGLEIVAVAPPALADSALGRAVAEQLARRRWGMWRREARPPALAGAVAEAVAAARAAIGEGGGGSAAGGGAACGCHVVTFERRRLRPEDVRAGVRESAPPSPLSSSSPLCLLALM